MSADESELFNKITVCAKEWQLNLSKPVFNLTFLNQENVIWGPASISIFSRFSISLFKFSYI